MSATGTLPMQACAALRVTSYRLSGSHSPCCDREVIMRNSHRPIRICDLERKTPPVLERVDNP
jgi:hypothetical protein